MLGYITIGANDLSRSAGFYAAILTPLGYAAKEAADGVEFTAPDGAGGAVAVYVKKPFDGKAATFGNGSMIAFRAAAHAMVRSLHADGLQAGGSDEGAPGFREAYSAHFFVAYLRDPAGNKGAIYCADPAQGMRGC